MKNIIEYFYRIEIDEIRFSSQKYYILSDNNKYVFEELRNSLDMKLLEEISHYDMFHKIITNIHGGIVTNYENINYVLLKINMRENRQILLDDIKKVSDLPIFQNFIQVDWNTLWSKKIDNFEKYIMNKDILLDFREYYDYFIGLGENAIVYYKYANKENLKIGFTYNRIGDDYTLLDLYNPLSISISPIVKGIAEYIKESFFNNNPIDVGTIEHLNLNYDDTIALFSRLLFPTYFFDIYKNPERENRKKIEKIIELSTSYEIYLKTIFMAMKKRYKQIPQIRWLVSSQL